MKLTVKRTDSSSKEKLTLPKKIKILVSNSFFVTLLIKFANFIHNSYYDSLFYKIFSGYDEVNEYVDKSVIGNIVRKINYSKPKKMNSIKYKFKVATEQSCYVNFTKWIVQEILKTSLQSYGIGSLTVSIVLFIIALSKKLGFGQEIAYLEYVIPTILFAMSIPALASKGTLAHNLNSSLFLKLFLVDIFGFDSLQHQDSSYLSTSKNHPIAMIVIGVIIGLSTIFIQTTYVLIGLLCLILLFVIVSKPEYGIGIIFFALPLLPTMYLAALLIVTACSQAYKILVSKRVIKISLIDLPVTLFIISIVFSGVISVTGSNIKKMLLSVCFVFAYYLTKDLLRGPKQRLFCISTLTFSSALVSLYGILQYALGDVSSIWQDLSKFSDIKGRVVSTFDNPNVLGEYLLVMIPISLISVLISKRIHSKIFSALSFIMNMLCLILTWSRGAWLAFVITFAIMLIVINKKWICAYILCIPPAVVGLSYFGGSVVNRFLSIFTFNDTSALYRLGIYEGASRMISDYYLYGIGLGDAAFAKIYPLYAVSGTQAAIHSHNLYFQILLEQGIFGIIVFALVVFITIQMSLYYRKTSAPNDEKLIVLSFFTGFVSLLIMGMTDYIWYNNRIFLLFWLIIGFIAASVNSQRVIEKANANSIYD